MSDYFIKLAEEKEQKRNLAKDIFLVTGGTALGSLAGHGASALVRERYRDTLDKIDPKKRVKYLAPAAGVLGAGVSLAHILRQNAEKRRNEQRKTSRK